MMFLFQDGADDRKNCEHNVINVCCAAGLLVTQDAICEVSATMVLSTSEVQEFQATVSNCNTRSFFVTHCDLLTHHPFHILQSLCDACVWLQKLVDMSHLCCVIHGVTESDGVTIAFVSVPERCAVIFLFVDGVDDRTRSDQCCYSFVWIIDFCHRTTYNQ